MSLCWWGRCSENPTAGSNISGFSENSAPKIPRSTTVGFSENLTPKIPRSVFEYLGIFGELGSENPEVNVQWDFRRSWLRKSRGQHSNITGFSDDLTPKIPQSKQHSGIFGQLGSENPAIHRYTVRFSDDLTPEIPRSKHSGICTTLLVIVEMRLTMKSEEEYVVTFGVYTVMAVYGVMWWCSWHCDRCQSGLFWRLCEQWLWR